MEKINLLSTESDTNEFIIEIPGDEGQHIAGETVERSSSAYRSFAVACVGRGDCIKLALTQAISEGGSDLAGNSVHTQAAANACCVVFEIATQLGQRVEALERQIEMDVAAGKHIRENAFDAAKIDVERVIYKSRQHGLSMATIRDQSRKFKSITTQQQDQVIKMLVEDGTHVAIKSSGERGRKTYRYMNVEFIEAD
jgi:hypothetical protein